MFNKQQDNFAELPVFNQCAEHLPLLPLVSREQETMQIIDYYMTRRNTAIYFHQ